MSVIENYANEMVKRDERPCPEFLPKRTSRKRPPIPVPLIISEDLYETVHSVESFTQA
jgi:hypothetical protein